MTSKKILIVNDGFPPATWGGANSIASIHAFGLAKHGYAVAVFTTTQDSKGATGWGEYGGVRIFTVYTKYNERWWAYRSLYNPEPVRAFAAVLDEFKPDIIHFHNIHHYSSYHCIALARKSGAKVFLTAHDVMSFAYEKLGHFVDTNNKNIPGHFNYHISWWQNFLVAKKRFNPLRNFCIRQYLKKADKIFAVSNALRDALMQNGIGNVEVVHNGIDVESFSQSFDEDALKKVIGLRGEPIVLFMGRLTPPKGSEVLFQTLQKVLRQVPMVKLLAVGTPMDRGIQETLVRFGVEQSVMLYPAVRYEEVYKMYRLADVVVVPSIILDSFPTVNLEAMAAGKPVVATCFGGSAEAVEDGVTGYIVNPLNSDLFAEKITLLLQDPRQAGVMGEAGCVRVKEHFTSKHMLDAYCEYY